MGDKVLACNGCGKQRWAPRVPEAIHGWKQLQSGQWVCPECWNSMGTESAPEVIRTDLQNLREDIERRRYQGRSSVILDLPAAERIEKALAAHEEMVRELRVLRAVALSMPAPKLGEWNWPEIAARAEVLLGKIGDELPQK